MSLQLSTPYTDHQHAKTMSRDAYTEVMLQNKQVSV